MKKKILFFSMVFAFLCLCFTPQAYAQDVEPSQTVEDVVNSTETTNFVEKTFVYEMCSIKLISETKAVVTNLNTLEEITLNYSISNNVLTLCNGEDVLMFTINEDGTLTPYEVENNVTVGEMAEDFLNRWLSVILSFVTGIFGSAGIVLIGNVIVKRMTKRLEDGVNLNAEERAKLAEDIINTKKEVEEYKETLKTQLLEMKNVVPEMIEDFKELKNKVIEENEVLMSALKDQSKTIDTLKDLICKLVASNPSLASNGYATQIIAICDGFSKGGVEDEQDK